MVFVDVVLVDMVSADVVFVDVLHASGGRGLGGYGPVNMLHSFFSCSLVFLDAACKMGVVKAGAVKAGAWNLVIGEGTKGEEVKP